MSPAARLMIALSIGALIALAQTNSLPPEVGIVDAADIITASDEHRITSLIETLQVIKDTRLVILVEPPSSSRPSAPVLLSDWLQDGDSAQAAVLRVAPESGSVDLALSPALQALMEDQVRATLTSAEVEPALDTNGNERSKALGAALAAFAKRLSAAVPQSHSSGPVFRPVEGLTKPPPLSQPSAWIGLPALLGAALVAWRRSWWVALLSIAPLLLLYGGIYLAVRFGGPLGLMTLPIGFAPAVLLGPGKAVSYKPRTARLEAHYEPNPSD